jgi:hypothetical protein
MIEDGELHEATRIGGHRALHFFEPGAQESFDLGA